jgi:hypothetical protein
MVEKQFEKEPENIPEADDGGWLSGNHSETIEDEARMDPALND